jgi:FKBP12-rapamycin complex-associated protein
LTTSGIAEKCEAWAKALHYKEIEFRTQPGETCEALISINHKLDLPEAAAGVLHYAQEVYHIEQESWYEKLQRWETALAKYEAKQVRYAAHQTAFITRAHHLTRNSGNV